MGRTLQTLIVAVGAMTLMAGCGGREIASDPPTAHTRSPSATPTLMAPVMPALARKHTKAGAKAFAEYYWTTVGYAQHTLDTSSLAALANPECEACVRGAEALDAIRARGGVSRGGDITVANVDVQILTGNAIPLARVTLDVKGAEEEVHYPSPAADETYPAATARNRMLLSQTPESWRVEMIEVMK